MSFKNELAGWLAGLERIDRLIVVLRFADELEPWDIAAVLGMDEAEVRRRMTQLLDEAQGVEAAAARVRASWGVGDPGQARARVPLGGSIFTLGQAADICGVSHRTCSKWCDSQSLKSYKLPLCNHRRIKREDLVEFLRAHGMPSQRPDLLQTAEIGPGA